ncbi:MAG: hypothetical protein HY778_02025 [Betaproteobacteria bacterium]|nr:hypothetical protein [Betaproteobacteria bacterium]
MIGFEDYHTEVRAIEREITLLGMALRVDWNDAAAVRQLACQAMDCRLDGEDAHVKSGDRLRLTHIKLFGAAQLMLTVMEKSASRGIDIHGGPVWKAFGRALWAEARSRTECAGTDGA